MFLSSFSSSSLHHLRAAAATAARKSRHLRRRSFSSSASPATDSNETVGPLHFTEPYVDLQRIRENADRIQANANARGMPGVDAHRVALLSAEYNKAARQLDMIRHERNRVSAALKSTGRGKKTQKQFTADTEEPNLVQRQALIEEGRALKAQINEEEPRVDSLYSEMMELAILIPNDTHPASPVGDEDACITVETHSGDVHVQARAAQFVSGAEKPMDHIELCDRHRLVDFDAAARTSGSSFYFLRNEAALLELALTQFAMHRLASVGYTPVLPPDLIRENLVHAAGFQPRAATHSQVYSVQPGNLALAGTAEIPLAGMFAHRTIDSVERVVAQSHSFRVEDGGRGAATRGLYRVHQFTKVEIFAASPPSQSEAVFDEICQVQRDMFADLGLATRTLEMSTRELGAPAYRKWDVEAWMPGRDAWGEISSTSNCTDYQSRRLNIRSSFSDDNSSSSDSSSNDNLKNKKKRDFAHTLNGTACAVPRMIIALLEQRQCADGSVDLPAVLHPYMPAGMTRIPAESTPWKR